MTEAFDKAFEIVLDKEGGYSNHAWDNGGETRYGISKARYPHIDIKSLTVAQAKELYRQDYWLKYRCGELPWALAMLLFDCVVNHSPVNPIRWLQNAVDAHPDGAMGPRTLLAANRCGDPVRAAVRMTQQRIEYVKRLSDYDKAGKGWHARHVAVLAEAIRWENNRPQGGGE